MYNDLIMINSYILIVIPVGTTERMSLTPSESRQYSSGSVSVIQPSPMPELSYSSHNEASVQLTSVYLSLATTETLHSKPTGIYNLLASVM